jgi:hypothetical protein
MNFLALIHIIDKNLIYAFISSIIHFIFNKCIIFLILNIPDESLGFIDKLIKIKTVENIDSLLDFSYSDDSETESDLENENYTTIKNIKKEKTLAEYNKNIAEWEYEVVLRMLNIPNIIINRLDENDKIKVPVLCNLKNNSTFSNYSNYNNTDLIIIDAFLFNMKINPNEVEHKFDIYLNKYITLKRKIKLFYILQNKLNTSIIYNLFPYYKYLYILYQKTSDKYDYILIDLENNHDLIKNKKVLFNMINL